jgi:outer membrane immunogenic protein
MPSKIMSLLAVAFSLGFAQAASAADMPVKAQPMAPVAAPYSWTGCFVGGHVGGLWATKDWTVRTGGLNSADGGDSINSLLGGAQLGCDYQFSNRFVIGIQGDYAWADAHNSHTDLLNATISDGSRVKALASVTGRVGYTWDRFLGYVRGGGAWVRDDYNGTIIATGAAFDSANETRGGWTVGVGGEYAFTNNISAFVEYDYYGFGTRQLTFLNPAGAVTDLIDIRQRVSVVKAGLNYRFWTGQ